MKRDALDAVFSDCVREAADWTCARCSRVFPDRKGKDIHASHFYSRSYNATRWFPDNVSCLCAACHDHLGKHPDDHSDFIRGLLGPVRYGWLRERKARIYRYRDSDKRDMRKHYRDELERMTELRANGCIGPLQLVAYD